LVQEFRTPDVYFERVPNAPGRSQRLEKVKIDRAGFLGFAPRGPVGTPVRIQSWAAFEDIFGGFAPDCFLPQSVFGFFANGGEVAYVCRIARLEGEDAATPARARLRDVYGRPTLEVVARDPGTWGNKLRIRAAQASKPPRTSLRANLAPGMTEAHVDVVKGFEPGAVVKITDGDKTEFAVLGSVDRKKLIWKDHELKHAYDRERTTIEAVEVQLQISSKDAFEIHDNLALVPGHPRDLVARVNEASRLVRVSNLASLTPPPYNLPASELEEALAGGKDGSGAARPEDFLGWDRGPADRGGLMAFDDVEELGLLLAPDLSTLVTKRVAPPPGSVKVAPEKLVVRDEREIEHVQKAMVAFCERKMTCFAILDTPPGLDPDQALEWRSHFDTKYAAVYYPWLKVLDPQSRGTRLVPPSGHVAGLYSRMDQEQGVHKAPANEILNDVIGLERDVTKDTTDQLAPEGVNCIRALRGRGIRVWGARTLSSETQWQHVNVRRVFIMVERSISEGTDWAVFETNDWHLWKSVQREVSRFLTGIWKEGMLRGNVPDEAYWVRCDETTNPPEERDAGKFICDIGIAAVRPAEFIVFRIGQRTQDIITEEPVS
jgi:hypothetical protein